MANASITAPPYHAELVRLSGDDPAILYRPDASAGDEDVTMEDYISPIEDSLIVATRGRRRDLIARADRGHVGNPGAEDLLYQWIDNAVAGKP